MASLGRFLLSNWRNGADLSFATYAGIGVGVIEGHRRKWKRQRTHPLWATFVTVTMYQVPRAQRSDFESWWNRESQIAHRQRGYVWTRLYKAFDHEWDTGPCQCQYVECRLWNTKEDYKRWEGSPSYNQSRQRMPHGVADSMNESVKCVDDFLHRMWD